LIKGILEYSGTEMEEGEIKAMPNVKAQNPKEFWSFLRKQESMESLSILDSRLPAYRRQARE
jgi:hypothetical protein